MIHPVLRVLVERAAARRVSLLGLVSVIPEGFWVRRVPGDDWSAREHLVHALTADDAVAEFIAGSPENADLEAARAVAMTQGAELPMKELLELAAKGRSRLIEVLFTMTPVDLERALPIPGAVNAWGERLSITVFQYLEQWAAHDAVHEAAIREAIATPPDLTAIAMTRRRR
jgi:DinB family protein